MATAVNASPDPNFMLSLARGLDVLRAFAGRGSLTMAEAARATGLSRPSAGRCLHTLTQLGYVLEREGRYHLTPLMLPLACGYLTATPLASASQAVANSLRDRLQETISVGVLDPVDPGRIIYIARSERNQVIAAPLLVGSTLPSHCTSMGRVLLAALDRDRLTSWLADATLDPLTERTLTDKTLLSQALQDVADQHWSIVEEELERGLRSLAVPVRNRTGEVVAALNVATFSNAHDRAHLLDTYLPELRASASQLERAL